MWPDFYASASQVSLIKPLPVKDNSYLLMEQECIIESHYILEPALGQCLAIAENLWRFAHHFWTNSNFDVSILIPEINNFV